MGNEGGLILKRKDLVKQQSHNSKEELNDAKIYNTDGKWSSCTLSNKPLEVPIVSDYRGNLYNKESILEILVDPEDFSEKQKELVKHIASLKDVVELKLQKDPVSSRFICSITGNVLGSNGIKYVYLVKCHDVFAEKCLKEINAGDKKCPLCNESYEDDEVIILNPNTKDDIQRLENRIQKLKSSGLSHSLKKLKKSKREVMGLRKRNQPTRRSRS